MEKAEFERVAQEAFDDLPEAFREKIENVHIVVEPEPSQEALRKSRVGPGSMLLGLYEGIPLSKRGEHYGVYPVVPDKITLYQTNIESVAASERAIRHKIREVLIHEIGHYFGMTEREIRDAGY